MNPVHEIIKAVLNGQRRNIDIARTLNIPPSTSKYYLDRLVRDGILVKRNKIYYTNIEVCVEDIKENFPSIAESIKKLSTPCREVQKR